jgi:NDP-sugar pyrophosphorylase family protein
MRGMLVAAGFGTRLDPLTRWLPKPALPIANRPAAWFACDHLARSGITDLVVNAHHLAERLQRELLGACPAGVNLRFVHEPQILGTGGGLRNAWLPVAGESFVVMNAKLVFAPDLARAVAHHEQSRAIATMVLRALPPGSNFAPVEVESDGRVRRIRGLPGAARADLAPRMFTGVQILSARAWSDLPLQGDLIEHAYIPWLARGECVASITDEGPWMDVGVSPRHYLDANLALADGSVRWPGITPMPSCTIMGSDTFVGAGCALDHVVVGEGVAIASGTTLRRTVVWRGARVTCDLSDAVVVTDGTVVAI